MRFKKITFAIAIIMMLLLNSNIAILANNKPINSERIILIDPGHGGFDGGAVSPMGTVEKDINLKISIKLKDKLEEQGYKVVMTREDDRALYDKNTPKGSKKKSDLNNRCKLKTESNCNMFISIHLNKFPESKYYGAQVWHSKNAESEKLAKIIQENFNADIDSTNNRVEKPANGKYKILRCNDEMPSIIIECGFLSNLTEENKLKDAKYQENIAECIKKSINMYFEKQ